MWSCLWLVVQFPKTLLWKESIFGSGKVLTCFAINVQVERWLQWFKWSLKSRNRILTPSKKIFTPPWYST